METKTLIRNKFFNDDDEYCCEEIILNDKIKTKAWILITHSYLNQCPKKLNKKEVVEKCKDCWIKFEEKDFELEYLYCFFMKHAPTGDFIEKEIKTRQVVPKKILIINNKC